MNFTMKTLYLLLVVFSITKTISTENGRPEYVFNHRLPNNTKPLHYNITTSVFLEPDFRFDGHAEIEILVIEDTNGIVMHADTLDIISIALDGHSENVRIDSIPEADFLVIKLNKDIIAGTKHIIDIKYKGKIRDDMTGFYKSSYFTKNMEKRWLAVTQMQPTSARYVFPCYDEPSFKASFSIRVECDSKLKAISNKPELETKQLSNGRSLTSFEKTPSMSSYLVAFLVSDYEALHNNYKNFNVWTNKESLHKAQFALDFGQKARDKLIKFTGKSYQLTKLDLVDVPDFKMGAMENWGMHTFRTKYILYEDGISTTANKQGIAKMIAHEISHNWFGNEVTPAWWDWVWLSEGLATVLESQVTDQIHPEWRMMDQFAIKMQDTMVTDSTVDTQAMSAHIPTKDKILFDYIVYTKSGSVLRMVQHFLTKEVFQFGLQSYLKERSYENAVPSDLFNALEEEARNERVIPNAMDLHAVLNSWTTQAGYPLVTVTRNYTNAITQLRQERFLADGTIDTKTRFWIPLNYGNISSNFEVTRTMDWIRDTDESVIINLATKSDAWIIVNKQQTGYYRVNYDETNWKLLAKTLNSSDYDSIHVLNRAQILDDSINLALAGRLNYTIALDLVSYLHEEHDYIPWAAVNDELNYLNLMLHDSCSFEAFMEHLIRPVLKDLTFDEKTTDSNTRIYHRSDVISWVCKLNLAGCSKAKHLLDGWRNRSNSISPNTRAAVYCGGLRNDDEDLWSFMKNQLNKTIDIQERTFLLTGLGCSLSKKKLQEYLNMSIDDKSIILKKMDRDLVFQYVYSSSPLGTELALVFLVSQLEKIQKLYNSLANSFIGLASYLKSENDVMKFISISTRFYNQLTTDEKSAMETAINIAGNNLNWLNNYHDVVLEWLVKNGFEKPCIKNTSATVTFSAIFIVCSMVVNVFI